MTSRHEAQAAFEALTPLDKKKCNLAWGNAEVWITARFGVKGTKVFEVHHAVEQGRDIFFVALKAGKTPGECLQQVRAYFYKQAKESLEYADMQCTENCQAPATFKGLMAKRKAYYEAMERDFKPEMQAEKDALAAIA